MSTQRYSVTPHPIETLLTWVKSGEIAIPEIQRPFVWETSKVRNLLDSLYQGYPVGIPAQHFLAQHLQDVFVIYQHVHHTPQLPTHCADDAVVVQQQRRQQEPARRVLPIAQLKVRALRKSPPWYSASSDSSRFGSIVVRSISAKRRLSIGLAKIT